MSGRRRILMMINFFPPVGGGGVYRPLSFVKYLSRMSWEVTVITPEPGGFWISDPELERSVPAEVRVVRTRSLSGQSILASIRRESGGSRRSTSGFGLLRRMSEILVLPDSYAGWIPFASREALRLCGEEEFDVIYSTSPPDSTHLAAHRVVRSTRLPWVADFRDPWIGLHLRRPPSPLHRAVHRRMEAAVAAADTVLVTTDWQRERLLSDYPGSRVEKVPNGYDEEDFRHLSDLSPASGPFTVAHCGMLTLGRGTRPFLDGLSLLARRERRLADDMRVVFAGARESANERWAERPELKGMVEFVDNLPHRECLELEKKSHILLLIKHDDPRYRGLVPGKLYEYFGACRPVLAVAPPGEAASLILDNRRGEVAGPGSPEEIADALSRMYSLHREGRLDESYSLLPLPGYSRRAAAERLAGILEGLAGRTGPGEPDTGAKEGKGGGR